jgi:hypothetical protein
MSVGERVVSVDYPHARYLAHVDEILPGVFHWTALHPNIRSEVSSYWLERSGVLFDPLIPPDAGLGWFAARPVRPTAVVLSNRHHYRDSGRFAERFDCAVHCNRAGLHEFSDALVIADGVVRGGAYGHGGPLGFVPDSLMDDPPATKRGLLDACARLLEELEFDHLLLAHGGPVLHDGRALLQELVDCGGRTAFEF